MSESGPSAATSSDRVVDDLAAEWDIIGALLGELDESEWDAPTALPGWTVKDCVGHMTGTERVSLGDPAPEVDIAHLDHVKNPFGEIVEVWVEQRRPWPPSRVAAEFEEQMARRVAGLRAMSGPALDEVTATPLGQMSYRDFLKVRVFDCWMHEQDIRRATGRPGHLDGPIVETALERFDAALGYVVGKKAAAPDGSSVLFVLDAGPRRTIGVVVEGRARVVPTIDGVPTATLTMPFETFVARAGGRCTAADALDEGTRFDGDERLARAVLDALAFTP